MTDQERQQGIGALDFHWPYPMEGGWVGPCSRSAGHVYAQAIRGANADRTRAYYGYSYSRHTIANHPSFRKGAGITELRGGIPAYR